MKKIIAVFICAVIVICTLFSGCDSSVSSVDGLIRPPKLSGENSLLQQEFEKSVDNIDNIIMKTPLNGDYRSSYLLFDIDNNGIEEAIVFFSNPSLDNYVIMNLFEYDNGSWKFVSSNKGLGEEILKIDFADLNGDKRDELLISWSITDKIFNETEKNFKYNGDKVITIYNYSNNLLNIVESVPFTNLYAHDLDNNGSDELLLIDIDLTNNSSRTFCKIISFNEDFSIVNRDEIKLSNMIDVLNIESDNVIKDDKKYTRVFIDGMVSESAMLTDVILISQNDFSITLPLDKINSSDTPLTIRTNGIFCSDIDNDGKIEIPMSQTTSLSGSDTFKKDDMKKIPLTVWNELDTTELIQEFGCIYNGEHSYMIKISKEISDNIVVYYDRKNSVMSFYSNIQDSAFNILNIKVFPELKWNKDREGYVKLSSNGTVVYTYKLFDSSLITAEYVEENFIVLK